MQEGTKMKKRNRDAERMLRMYFRMIAKIQRYLMLQNDV